VKTPEYQCWAGIKDRCTNPNCADYPDWGGRGIGIASEWRNDFAAFLFHIGPRPSPRHSIDRIDNDLGYVPGNVRWGTPSQQIANRRSFTLTCVVCGATFVARFRSAEFCTKHCKRQQYRKPSALVEIRRALRRHTLFFVPLLVRLRAGGARQSEAK
jgi:hypothetical protein